MSEHRRVGIEAPRSRKINAWQMSRQLIAADYVVGSFQGEEEHNVHTSTPRS
ncbi:hypothetical protein FHX06_005783 [Rhizobium sp. BK512]|jgi:hypothetical protein|nr:hypothetical protein [Rhizobium sp. BK512]